MTDRALPRSRPWRIDRRAFLVGSSALTVASAASRANAAASRSGRNDRTAAGLLLDMIQLRGEPDGALDTYVGAQAKPLLAAAATSGSVFHLREQQEPASTLGDQIYFAAYQLADGTIPTKVVPPTGPNDRWRRVSQVRYAKMADYGRPDPAADPPEAIMIVVSHPTDVGHDALYNEWYTDNHMIDVARSPHFRSATRYRPARQIAGVPLAYLCIYEIEHAYTPDLHTGVMHWLRDTPDDFRQSMPTTPAGEGVLTLDIWGYCQRVWSSVAG